MTPTEYAITVFLLSAAALWLAMVIVAIGADEMLCVVGCM